MKTLATILGIIFFLNAQAQTLDTTCVETKESVVYKVIDRGTIVHQTCRDGRNMFFYKPYDPYELSGYLRGRSQISGGGWYISSHGPHYFVVTNKSGTKSETYNFTTKDWSSATIKPPWWSTGEREE